MSCNTTVDTDECSRLSPCSHICTNTAGGFRCSCPLGLALDSDAKSCKGKWLINDLSFY